MKIYNIEAVIIHELSAPLLLGQTAIQKLGKIQLEGDELIILSAVTLEAKNACLEAEKLLDQAANQFADNLFSLAANTYQKAYDLCPDGFYSAYLFSFGLAYYFSFNYPLAIKYLEKAKGSIDDTESLSFICSTLGECYRRKQDYRNAIINYETSLSYSTTFDGKSHNNSNIALVYFEQSNFNEAKNYYERSAQYYLKSLNGTLDDIQDGKIKDEVLGEIYWNIAKCCSRLKLDESYILLNAFYAAFCGDGKAREYLRGIYGRNDMDFDKRR